MAQDIVQTIGFDASQAIASIDRLNTALGTLNTTMTALGQGIGSWNKQAANVNKIFGNFASAADKAHASLMKLSGVSIQPSANFDTGNIQHQLALINQVGTAFTQLPKQAGAGTRAVWQAQMNSLAQFAANNKVTASQMAQAFAQVGQTGSAALNPLQMQVNALASAWTKMNASATASMTSMRGLVSVFGRFVVLHEAMQLMNGLKQAFIESIDKARDFGIAMTEIVTISADVQRNMGGYQQRLIEISNLTGRDLTDTTRAYYQTLSNQVGGATESLLVFEEAAKLAVVTQATNAQSVDLMTAAMNSFGMSASQSHQIAADLFTAIEVGRFKAEDLANIIGRVGPIAKDVGLDLREMLNAIALMTIRGVRADTAITQLRAVITQLLKPTEEMKRLWETSFGVETAEQAIAKAGGLLPLLIKLQDETGGSSQDMAELFKNVRALAGALGVLGGNLQASGGQMEVNAKKFEQAGARYQNALDLFEKSPAQGLKRTQTQIENTWIELGQKFIGFKTALLEGYGAILETFNQLPAIMSPAIVSGFVTSMAAMTAATFGFTAAAKSLLLIMGPIVAGFAIGAFLGEGINKMLGFGDSLHVVNAEFQAMSKHMLDVQKKFNAEALTKQIQQIDKANKSVIASLSEWKVRNADATKSIINDNKALVAVTKNTLDGIVDAQQNIVDKLSKGTVEADKEILESTKRTTTVQQDLENKRFDWYLERLNERQQAFARANKAQEQISAGLAQLSRSRTQEEVDAAKALIEAGQKQAESASSEAASIQDVSQKRSALMRARQAEVAAAEALLSVEARIRQNAEQAKAARDKQLQEEIKRLTEIQGLVQRVNKGITLTGEGGELLKGKEAQKGIQDAMSAMDQLQRMLTDPAMAKKLQLSDILGVGDLQRQLKAAGKGLPSLKGQIQVDWATQVSALSRQAQNFPVELRAILTAQGGALDILDPLGDAQDRMGQINQKAQEAATTWSKAKDTTGEMRLAFDRLLEVLPQTIQKGKGLRDWWFQDNETLGIYTKAMQQAVGIQQQLRESPVIGPQQIEQINQFAATWDQFWQKMEGKSVPAQNSVKRRLGLEGEQVGEINAALDGVKNAIGSLDTYLGGNLELIQQQADAWNAANTNANLLLGTAERIKQTLESTRVPQLPVVTGRQAGGMIYRAEGGFIPRGTDTVPLMATPGEYVMNAQATRRFYSQLVAMNAGVKPQYHAEGGSVTNFGDIHVSVSGSKSGQQTAREIASALRRELRRGTTTLS
ncbi:MAG: hypothetical protein AMXMBFR16_10330 [Candidatus Uhrbacteria bacterium]